MIDGFRKRKVSLIDNHFILNADEMILYDCQDVV